MERLKRNTAVVIFLATSAWAMPCFGQAAVPGLTTFTSNAPSAPMAIYWNTSPADIACVPGSSNCMPLNLAACNQPAVNVSLTATATPITQSSAPSQSVFVWGLLNSGTCSNGWPLSATTSTVTNAPNGSILLGEISGVTSTFATVTGRDFAFPGDPPYSGGLDPNGVVGTSVANVFTHLDIMNQYNACDPNGAVNLSTYFICIGADIDGNGCVGNSSSCGTNTSSTTTTGATTSAGSIIGYAQVQIDTIPPLAPTTPAVKALNGRVKFATTYDAAGLDTWYVNVLYSSDPNNVALAQAFDASNPNTTGCSLWTENFVTLNNQVTPNGGSLDLIINGDNGTTYAYCAQAIDYLQNVSFFSAPVIATPHFECDLFECWPDEDAQLQTGFCGANLAPGWYFLPIVAFVFRRRWCGASKSA